MSADNPSSPFMTLKEAAAFLRYSASNLYKRTDIPRHPAQEIIEAGKMIERIKAGHLNGAVTRTGCATIADFKKSYLAELKERGVIDLRRSERASILILSPPFTAFPQAMQDIVYSDGQAYIAKRRRKELRTAPLPVNGQCFSV